MTACLTEAGVEIKPTPIPPMPAELAALLEES
jgi:hypothetical protein